MFLSLHRFFARLRSDGHTGQFSRSYLYFANRDGTRVYRLPYTMSSDTAAPELMP